MGEGYEPADGEGIAGGRPATFKAGETSRYDRLVWGCGVDGSPQWQIEALRRLEIPEDMQKRHGFKPLGAADGQVKAALFGTTNARLCDFDIAERGDMGPGRDRFAAMKDEYDNLRYAYVSGPVDWSAFA